MTDTCASLSPYGLIESQILEEKHNLTALRTIQAPSWVSNPEVRGTTNILWSCIVTIFACIYTALHLNVQTETKWNRVLLSKAKWVICGLLAPEVVLYLAGSQFFEAWTLVKELNSLLVKPERDVETGTGQHETKDVGGQADNLKIAEASPGQRDTGPSGLADQPRNDSGRQETKTMITNLGNSQGESVGRDATERPEGPSILRSETQGQHPQSCFNLRYGFFVVMGGLEVPVDDIEDQIEGKVRGEPGSGRLRLSSKGVLQLAKHGHFLPVPPSRISDKSKADTLQKALVMTQVLWMATTCITRKIYGLPLTLLEVHTLVHVVCAAILYAFWIEKPKDIQDPELLDSSGYTDLIALMYIETIEAFRSEWKSLLSMVLYPRCRALNPPLALERLSNANPVEKIYFKDGSGNPRHVEWVNAEDSGPEGHSLEIGQAFTFGIGRGNNLGWDCSEPGPIQFSKRSIEKWKRARAAVEDISGSIEEPEFLQIYLKQRYPHQHYHQAFCEFLGNLRIDRISEPTDLIDSFSERPLLLAISIVLPIVYGGIHLAAMKFEFPSGIERLLWEISAIFVMAALPFLTLVSLVVITGVEDYLFYNRYARLMYYRTLSCIIVIFLSLYILARLFLVIESFIGLRASPIGVYWTPAWLQMIPHV